MEDDVTDLAPLPPSMTGTELIVYVNGIITRMNTVGGTDMPLIPLPSPWEDVRPAIDAIEDRLARWEALGPEMADVLYAYQQGQDATDLAVSALVNDPTDTRGAVEAVVDERAVGKGELGEISARYPSLQAAVDATPTGGVLLVTADADLPITVSRPMTIRGVGHPTLTRASGGGGISVTSSGVTIEDVHLVGPGFGSVVGSHIGLNATGGTNATRLSGITYRRVTTQGWTKGLQVVFADDVTIERCDVRDVSYAGITLASVSGFTITGCAVTNVTQPTGTVSYGITVTQNPAGPSPEFPRSSGGEVTGNTIRDVASWEGIDTHSATNLLIGGNRVYGCRAGIVATSTEKGSGNDESGAPQNITISDNIVDAVREDGGAGSGISLMGADPAAGGPDAAEYATGKITGNIVVGHGDVSDWAGGALQIKSSRGVAVTDNVVIRPGRSGLHLRARNYGYQVDNLSVVDVWANSGGTAVGVHLVEGHLEGRIGTVSLARGDKSAAVVNGARSLASSTNNVTTNDPEGEWVAYTPSWGASSSTPAIGNGSLTGRYKRLGKTVHFAIELVVGSTTDLTSGTYNLGLPFAPRSDTASWWIGEVRDSSPLAFKPILGRRSASVAVLTLFDGGNVNKFTPVELMAGDSIRLSGTYEAS